MNRRQFLIAGVAVSVATAAGVELGSRGFKAHWDQLMDQLRSMQNKELSSSGSWNPSQIFQHLAQSVQGSFQGYPEHKAAWFTHSVGPVALKAFKTAGAMFHPLDEVIPGMPQLDATMPTQQALQTLLQALELFAQSTRLSPHFAYGVLNQQDYQAAHVMHIRQHLQQIQSL
ncbi:Protein of unknown function (DUF1569) [Rheinheimera sp. A13L]|uniref:DUF1569 domain-containing protein n=1 Tax=Rheinheimera sp. A13L TaxID=506534 RepID=UPI0002125397|nr:DUF1569 domain-containing protein [Rheinheimera sp. A13L]EGM79115.1 Protein of unknown function (DUF1569) [Rheinheimera sp. A13L]